MRKITALILLFLTSLAVVSAQELPQLKDIKLNKKAQFKAAEPAVTKVIDYIFATPINIKNKERSNAGEFLLKWMNGTPDYTFILEEKETTFFNTDADLTLIYMAALARYKLHHTEITNQKQLVLGAMNIALPYLEAQENKKNWSKELWQLNEARQKGRLEAFLYK